MTFRYDCFILQLCLLISRIHEIEGWSSPSAITRNHASGWYGTQRCIHKSNPVTRVSSSGTVEGSIENGWSEDYNEEELQSISDLALLCEAASDNVTALQKVIYDSLPKQSPSLIMRLRRSIDHRNEKVAQVAKSMNLVMKSQLDVAKETLLTLLNAGEIRKLDSLIGKAAREGKLDIAFFNVLQANIQDSVQTSNENDSEDVKNEEKMDDAETPPQADRNSILRHIYTRCQEEVEKDLPPGTAFLNKLLRTNQQSIRLNLYKHYLLTPEEDNVITTPDGKTLQLKSSGKPLIEISEFVRAIDNAIIQIRTIENSRAITREAAAEMVEACRTLAKEARVIIGERYGRESTELLEFQNKLEPVFRPITPDSPYIKGR